MRPKDNGKIRVADISIAHLSRGLYRSTATAFKELVSNAYDADATEVRIDTNFPEFDFIACVDNGSGMSLDNFMRFFDQQGIGSSFKRKENQDITSEYERPIIGRLGIGMLAVGQLCHSFKIESHYKDNLGKGKAYSAEIVLLDDAIPDIEEIVYNNDTKGRETEVGEWEYQVVDFDEEKEGFRIYSSDVRSTFRQEMRMKGSLEEKLLNKMSFKLSDLHSRFYSRSRSIRDCKPYLETIWELALLCPLPYYSDIENCPVNLSSFNTEESKSCDYAKVVEFLKQRQQKLLDYKFHVIFDGIELRRLFQLPTEKDLLPKLYYIDFDQKIFGNQLKFTGYMFGQIAKAIRPLELNGLQIRLRGVGIGGYDSTFLKYYDQIPTVRKQWVSGEIFVDMGLESALNIDRDSFNEHDEHFKKLQAEIHSKLKEVFKKINSLSNSQNEQNRQLKEKRVKDNIKNIVDQQSNGKFKVIESDLEKDKPIIAVNEDKGEIILNRSSRLIRKAKGNEIMRSVMLAYYTAKHLTQTEEERDEKFIELLRDILGELV